MEACATLPGVVRPGFHGTSSANFPSIFQQGLLIPGQDNNLRVVNGSAHGLAIFTASIKSASLSFGFCKDIARERKMLVCGILDDTIMGEHSSREQYTLGHHSVVAESESVRHVGGAIVVFDRRRVAPLFEVSRVEQDRRAVAAFFDWTRHELLLERVLNAEQSVEKLRQKRTQRIGRYRRLMHKRAQSNTPAVFAARRGARKRRLKGI